MRSMTPPNFSIVEFAEWMGIKPADLEAVWDSTWSHTRKADAPALCLVWVHADSSPEKGERRARITAERKAFHFEGLDLMTEPDEDDLVLDGHFQMVMDSKSPGGHYCHLSRTPETVMEDFCALLRRIRENPLRLDDGRLAAGVLVPME